MENVHKHIEHSVSRRKKGYLIFPTDFRGKGTQTAIKTALSGKTTQIDPLSPR